MSEHALVFAPVPQLTVTIEQPADSPELHLHPGGQGIWQARMLTLLGVPVTLCAAMGGEVGHVLEMLAADEGLTLRTITREASSGWYVHDRRDGHRREIAEAPGEPLTRHELDELYDLALAEGLRAAVTVLSGPADPALVPADVFRRLAADLGSNDAIVVADLSGEELTAAVAGGVHLLKVSHEELISAGTSPDDSRESLTKAMHRLHADGARSVVVSRAGAPALVLLDGRAFEIDAPTLEAADTRGAGDSMTAGIAAVLARGGDLETAVRTGAAAGAVNVTRHGLGTGRADAIGALVDRVRLIPL